MHCTGHMHMRMHMHMSHVHAHVHADGTSRQHGAHAVPRAAPCSHRAPTPLPRPRPQTGKKYNYLQLKAMFRLADLDNSGSIDFNEFLHAQRRVKKQLEP